MICKHWHILLDIRDGIRCKHISYSHPEPKIQKNTERLKKQKVSKQVRFNNSANRSFRKTLISVINTSYFPMLGSLSVQQKWDISSCKDTVISCKNNNLPASSETQLPPRKVRVSCCVCCDVRQTSKTLWMVKFYSSRSIERGREIERNSATVQKSSCEIHTKNIVLNLHRLYCKSSWRCIPVWIYKRCIQVSFLNIFKIVP